MTADLFDVMDRAGAARLMLLRDAASGLRAVIALDDMTLGPAVGGIRTRHYDDTAAAVADAQRLAAAMTLKCAIAGVPAGGGKTVVLDGPELDRPAAFRRLGAFIEDLAGRYRAAGDLGTSLDDLLNAAEATRYVNTSGARLGEATGAGVVECVRALAFERGADGLAGLAVAVQGCGLIGAGVARQLAREGARLIVADVDEAAARALADELGASVVDPDLICAVEADILSPCAVGGVLTRQVVESLRVWGICGGANNQLAEPGLAAALSERGVTMVPDFLASAGAVIVGAARDLLGGVDPDPMIHRLGDTTRQVVQRAAAAGVSTVEVAASIARERIEAARRSTT